MTLCDEVSSCSARRQQLAAAHRRQQSSSWSRSFWQRRDVVVLTSSECKTAPVGASQSLPDQKTAAVWSFLWRRLCNGCHGIVGFFLDWKFSERHHDWETLNLTLWKCFFSHLVGWKRVDKGFLKVAIESTYGRLPAVLQGWIKTWHLWCVTLSETSSQWAEFWAENTPPRLAPTKHPKGHVTSDIYNC